MTITQEELNKMYFVYKEGYEDIEGVPVSDKEPSLGNPGTSGFVLSSTTAGVRSWVAQTGGMVYPAAGIAVSLGPGLGWSPSITDNSTNWNTAYTDRLKWDGGATGLVAATGRTSLGLGTAAVENVGYFATAVHTHSGYELAGTMTTHESTYNHSSFLTSVPHASIASWGTILLDGLSSTKYFRGDGTWQTVSAVPAAHNLVDTTNHPVAGLTTGYFLKATSPTTYAFEHHGITPAGINAATSTHAHGNITSAGAIGSTTGLPVITTTSGVLTVGSFGTTAGTFAQGNDTRFVSITPTPAEHQVTVWGGSATIKGMTGLTYNGTDLSVIGNALTSGDVVAYQAAGYSATIWDSIPVRYSVHYTGGYVQLEGETTDTPGNNKVYGTDGSGVKGWKADPTGGVTAHASLTQLDYASAGHTGFAPTSHAHAWSDLTSGVPSTFTPSTHGNSAHSETYITSAALSPYAPLASPSFTGTVTVAGARPITLTSGVISMKGDVGGWAMEYAVKGSADTHLGGFGALGSADALNNYYIGTYANQAFVVHSGGNVGIGTTAPDTLLHIYNNTAGITNQLTLNNYNTTAGYDGTAIYFKGYQGSLAKITGRGDPQNSTGGDLLFETYSDNTTVVGQMIMNRLGNVGIGTTAPETAAHLFKYVGAANDSTRTTAVNVLTIQPSHGLGPYTGFGGLIKFKNEIYGSGVLDTGYLGIVMGSSYETECDMVFGLRGSSSVAEKMRLSGAGNLSVTGTVTGTQLTANIAIGTAPLVITSTTKVNNLHVERATLADTITVADTADASCSVALFESATGNMAVKTDTGINYNATTGTITLAGDVIAYG